MNAVDVHALVMRYFNAWQEPTDWDAFRACLHDEVVFDPGGGHMIRGADALMDMLAATESPWRDVELLASTYSDGDAALFYEGTDRRSGVRTRVGEHVTVTEGGISRVVAVILPLPVPDSA